MTDTTPREARLADLLRDILDAELAWREIAAADLPTDQASARLFAAHQAARAELDGAAMAELAASPCYPAQEWGHVSDVCLDLLQAQVHQARAELMRSAAEIDRVQASIDQGRAELAQAKAEAAGEAGAA